MPSSAQAEEPSALAADAGLLHRRRVSAPRVAASADAPGAEDADGPSSPVAPAHASAAPGSPAERPASDVQAGGGASDAVIQSLMQPGLNTPLRRAMNLTFVLLLLTLTGLSVLTRGNPHFLALLAIASCLWATVTWYVLIMLSPCLSLSSLAHKFTYPSAGIVRFLNELANLPPSAFQVQQEPVPQNDSVSQVSAEGGGKSD